MITTFVQFELPDPITLDQARETFSGTAPRYRDVHGLVRKYYLLSEDGRHAGGVYLWRSKAAAERMFNDEWKAFIRNKYAAEPVIRYFESPVMVDNVAGEIQVD